MTANRVLTVLLVAGLAAWALLLRPPLLGGETSYVIVSGDSMLPTLRNGDLVVAREHDEYATGDVLVYAVPEGEPGEGVLIIHRVVGGDARSGYVLRGDNRENDDPWRPTPDEVRGSAVFDIPKVGLVLGLIASPLGLGLLAAMIAFLFVLPRKEDPPPPKDETDA